MALALAGALLQRVTRNPMAAPSVLGITDGAAVGVVTFLWVFSNESNALTVSIHWQPLAAAVGACLFAGLAATLTLLDPARPQPATHDPLWCRAGSTGEGGRDADDDLRAGLSRKPGDDMAHRIGQRRRIGATRQRWRWGLRFVCRFW